MLNANLLFLHALTGVHPGGGTALGVVDLPIQRERHTQWPMVSGSSLKGVLRDASRQSLKGQNQNQKLFHAAFGPEPDNASDFAGALSFTDARVLAFPVRSLLGVFAWVTCPAVLARFARDMALLLGNGDMPDMPSAVSRGKAICPAKSDLLIGDKNLLLEEFEFLREHGGDKIASCLADLAVKDRATADRMRRNLVVLSDNDFTHFVRHATEVIARIGLDYETKTARGKALFYEEFLPPETLFYAIVFATDSRSKHNDANAATMLKLLRDDTPEVIQIGADQTIGRGLCAVKILTHVKRRGQEISNA